MSDKLRTALKGGGRIIISVDRWANGDFHLCVTEDWARLTSIERATVSAEAVNAAEDPDGMIGAEIARLVAAAHISYETREKGGANGNQRENGRGGVPGVHGVPGGKGKV